MSSQQQRYRVIEKLASGGMAEVFRAESAGIEGFKKKVAIKRVLPHLSKKQKFISMFLDEARLSASLSHSNVVQVFDIGMGDNTYFIVMEFVDGADLKAISDNLRKLRRDFPVPEAVYITTKICEGLAYAHELADNDGSPIGIVHRDMSPPNVLITRHGEVKIADFGLAKASNQLEKSEPGVIKGKFSYLAPEACTGQDLDARADIFAVGIILWELLAGRKLFQGESDYQTVQQVMQAKIPPLAQFNPGVPPELEKVLHRALARNLDDRYRSARDFGRDLLDFLFHHGQPVGAFAVEDLVVQTMQAKEREKPVSTSIIDKLIEEALFEFTSLRNSDSGPEPGAQSKGPPGVHDWAAEIKIKGPYDSRLRLGALSNDLPSGGALEEGNLAALEDDPATATPLPSRGSSSPPARGSSAPPAARHSSSPPRAPSTPSPARQPSQPAPRSLPPASSEKLELVTEPEHKSSGLTYVIIALLVVAAGAAGAWFANVIPH